MEQPPLAPARVESMAAAGGLSREVAARVESMAAASGLSREDMFIAEMDCRNIPTSALIRESGDGVWIMKHNVRPYNGHTPMYYAVLKDWCQAIKWLLKKGAGVELCSRSRTALQMAAIYGCHRAALVLLDAGAQIDSVDHDGRTALHFAVGHFGAGNVTMCKLLLSRGASLDARTKSGRDPEAHARHLGANTTTADFLAAVRAAGGWRPHVAAQRKPYIDALVALRRELPAARRTAPTVPAHARLFLEIPDDVFFRVLDYWRTPYGY